MTKKILSLFLAVLILGSTTVYAIDEPQDNSPEESEEYAPVVALIITRC